MNEAYIKHVFDLGNKTAVVTGAGSGIGQGIAIALANCRPRPDEPPARSCAAAHIYCSRRSTDIIL